MITYDTRSFFKDGKPWFPVMGEYPYSRNNCAFWKEGLGKMKALGIDIVSSYCCWIHHEEMEGHYNFRGNNNLRRFAKEVKAAGMYLCLRVGPWIHAEVRNGGFPDWVEKKYGSRARSNDAEYMADVGRYFSQLCRQCEGLTYKEGGPIVAVQVENEYSQWGVQGKGIGDEHINALIGMLKDKGLDVPLYFATGWGAAATGEAIPVWGNYCEAPWENEYGELPPMDGYLFTDNPNDANIGSDTGKKEMKAAISRASYPYVTVELGSGIQVTEARRPVVTAKDCGAMALCKLGSGVSLLGYYVFHGGANPAGALSSMQEYRDGNNLRAGFCCDLPVFNYDFQAPIGQYGEMRPCARELKLWNYFIKYFGEDLCRLSVCLPVENGSDPSDLSSPRLAIRESGGRGYVFFNNYVRHYPMPERKYTRFSPAEGTVFSDFILKDGQYCAFPFGMDIGGAVLKYAEATPFCILNGEDYVFWAYDGQGCTEIEGEPRGKIIVLNREDALDCFCCRYAGKDRLFCTDGEIYERDGAIELICGNSARLKIYPAPEAPPCGFREAGKEGIFTVYLMETKVSPPALEISTAEKKQGFAEYALSLEYSGQTPHSAWLEIGYEGNGLEILLDGEKVADDLYTGRPYVFGLRDYGYPSRVTVRVLEMCRGKNVYLERSPSCTEGKVCRLTDVRAVAKTCIRVEQ